MAEPVVNVGKRQAEPILSVRDLEVTFGGRRGGKKVIDRVSFDLHAGETLSLVGESGSGKTTIGRAILGLAPVTGGSITFRGERVDHLSRRQRRGIARHIQVVFQDPYSSLNPALNVEDILVEPLRAAGVSGGRERIRGPHHEREWRLEFLRGCGVAQPSIAASGIRSASMRRFPAAFLKPCSDSGEVAASPRAISDWRTSRVPWPVAITTGPDRRPW